MRFVLLILLLVVFGSTAMQLHTDPDGVPHRRKLVESEASTRKNADRNYNQAIKTPRGGSSNSLVKDFGFLNVLTDLMEWIGASTVRSWFLLFVCICAEIGATSLMKIASDKGSLSPAIQSIVLYVFSLLGFGACLKKIEVSVAYAVWSALGTAIVSIFGMVFWGETYDAKKITSLVFLIIGVVGLNLSDEAEH